MIGAETKHWSECIEETLLIVDGGVSERGDADPNGLKVSGGAENGLFCWVCSLSYNNVRD